MNLTIWEAQQRNCEVRNIYKLGFRKFGPYLLSGQCNHSKILKHKLSAKDILDRALKLLRLKTPFNYISGAKSIHDTASSKITR